MYVAGHLEEYLARKNWVMRCWHGYLFGVKCKWFVHGQAQLLDNSLSLCKYHDDSMTTFYWLCQFSIGVVTLNDNIHSTAATLSLTTIKQSFNISSSLSTQPFTSSASSPLHRSSVCRRALSTSCCAWASACDMALCLSSSKSLRNCNMTLLHLHTSHLHINLLRQTNLPKYW